VVNNYYIEGLAVYEEMIRACDQKSIFEECLKVMTTQNIKYYVSKEINQLEYDPN
jgi:hypothetical protein